jgi:hypothetical protein
VPRAQQGPAAEEYFELVEQAHQILVDGGPYTLELPVLLGAARTSPGPGGMDTRYDTSLIGE